MSSWPRRSLSPLALACACCSLALLWAAPLWAGAPPVTIVVDETNLDWGFLAETGTPTSGYVLGPATPPMGNGSAQFDLPASADGVLVGTQLHAGTRLSSLGALAYSTYQSTAPQAVALQMNVDYDDTDSNTSWQGRLVYEPSYTETVLADTWQTWDAMASAGNGNWWSTGTPVVGDAAAAAACTQGNPCGWAELLGIYPNVAIHSGALAGLLLKAGSGWPAGFSGAVDALRIEDGITDTTYDFETTVPVELMSFSID